MHLQNKIARDCDVKRAKVIAVAFRKSGALITSSTNRCVLGSKDRFTFHAEELLIKKLRKIKAKERFDFIEVVVMRWSVTKGWTMAMPCEKCRELLIDYGINRVSYTDSTGRLTCMT